MSSLTQFALLGLWLGLAGLLYLLGLIARFYQRSSGERTYYRWYALPMGCFTLGVLRYLQVDAWAGDALGDLLWGLGGASLAWLCWQLYSRMTSEQGP